jgi:hypothetical protein
VRVGPYNNHVSAHCVPRGGVTFASTWLPSANWVRNWDCSLLADEPAGKVLATSAL